MKGMLALEQHVENPQESDLFQQFPKFYNDETAVTFLCDYIRLMTLGSDKAHEMETLMDEEIETHHNDHASTTGEGILTTVAGTISEPGTNNIYGKGPYTIVFGPEHAQTIHRDGFSIEDIQQKLYELSAVSVSRVSKEQQHHYETERDQTPTNGLYYLSPSPDDIHVLVAGGAGKHSAFIPTFGATAACSVKISHC